MSDDDKLKPTRPEVAAAQAAEFLGVLPGVDFDLGNGKTWRLPNPSFLPRDMKKRHRDHLRFLAKELDTDSVTTKHPVTGKEQTVERTIWPWEYKGELVDEDELLCIALMGTDAKKDRDAYFADGTLPAVYEQFLAAGGVAGQIQGHWRMMELQLEERVKRDDKSR